MIQPQVFSPPSASSADVNHAGTIHFAVVAGKTGTGNEKVPMEVRYFSACRSDRWIVLQKVCFLVKLDKEHCCCSMFEGEARLFVAVVYGMCLLGALCCSMLVLDLEACLETRRSY